ncbi:hypothetical protein GGD84_002136 [Rhodothalassium salexigens DSM 2132]|nr:hypothetical protein [Rhodothalassium salexigens DSM 2132]
MQFECAPRLAGGVNPGQQIDGIGVRFTALGKVYNAPYPCPLQRRIIIIIEIIDANDVIAAPKQVQCNMASNKTRNTCHKDGHNHHLNKNLTEPFS